MSPEPEEITRQTQTWLKTVVIGLNLCPFAYKVHRHNRIRYIACFELNAAYCLERLLEELRVLDQNPGIATTLLIYAEAFADFDDYLELLELAEDLLIDNGYEGIYQLAGFHPDYRFEGCDNNDPANYTNRSPYPMLHLIREDDIQQALAQYPQPENIPNQNIQLTRNLGLTKMRALLDACYQSSKPNKA